MTEALVMGLRLTEGVATDRIAPMLDAVAIERLAAQGLLVRAPDRIALTEAGAPLLDAVLREIAV